MLYGIASFATSKTSRLVPASEAQIGGAWSGSPAFGGKSGTGVRVRGRFARRTRALHLDPVCDLEERQLGRVLRVHVDHEERGLARASRLSTGNPPPRTTLTFTNVNER